MVLTAPRRFEQRDFTVPTVGAADGVLRIEACGLCGTDHEQYTGLLRNPDAFIPGHEVVGVVEDLGAEAAKTWGVQAGQRVAVEVFKSCRECKACKAGLYRRCERNGLATMVGFRSVDQAHGLGGGYATHLYLDPDSMLLPVPEGMDPIIATLFNPLGAGIRWGVDLPGTGPGDVVVILGPGIRGLCAAAAAKEAGAEFVAMTGLGSRDSERLALAGRFGVDLTIDVSRENPDQAVRKATGGKADIVIDVTAKAPAALGQAVTLAKPGGTIVLAGVRGTDDTPGFHPDHVVYKELKILGALGVDIDAYERALTLIDSRRYPFEDLSRKIVGFDDIEPLLQSMAGEVAEPAPLHGVFSPEH